MGAVVTGYRNTLKIVVFCLSPLGDTLFATPAVRALRENYPKAHILIIATPAASKILSSNPFDINVLGIKNQIELFSLLAAIRKSGYDLAVGLSPFGSFLTRLCATPLRAGLSTIGVDDCLSVVEACLAALRVIGIRSNSSVTEFWINPPEKAQADMVVCRFLERMGYRFTIPLIAVHCGGHYFIRKRWPLANFIKFIQQLQAKGGHQVVLIGGSEDIADARVIQAEVPEVISGVGFLTLAETAVLLSKCRLMVGNDSGPLHLAAAVGIPTIGLFGPTSPKQFYPYFPPDHVYCYKHYSCSPCYRYRGGLWQYLPRCAQSYCMEAITPGEVLSLARQFLNYPSATENPLKFGEVNEWR